jgi:hypothetical protein
MPPKLRRPLRLDLLLPRNRTHLLHRNQTAVLRRTRRRHRQRPRDHNLFFPLGGGDSFGRPVLGIRQRQFELLDLHLQRGIV